MHSIADYITETLNSPDEWEKLFAKMPPDDIADSLYRYSAEEYGINLSDLKLNDRFYQIMLKSSDSSCTNEGVAQSFKALNRYYIHHQWDKKRQIYVLDSDFAEELMRTQNINILKDMFLRLPYNTFALDFSKSSTVIENAGIAGAVVDIKLCDGYWFIKLSTFRDLENGEKGYGMLNLFVENKEIDCSPEEFVETYCRVFKEENASLFQCRKMLWNFLIHVLIYFSSYEPDIRETAQSKAQCSNYRRQKKKHQSAKPIRFWDVGERYGSAFRKWTKGSLGLNKSSESSNGSKRPHLRRAHWHRYWIGKKGQQELVIKWVPDCFVNEHIGELSITKHRTK